MTTDKIYRRPRGSVQDHSAVLGRVRPEAKSALVRFASSMNISQSQAIEELILAADIREDGHPAALPHLGTGVDERRASTPVVEAHPRPAIDAGQPGGAHLHALPSRVEVKATPPDGRRGLSIDQTNWLCSQGYISDEHQRRLHRGMVVPPKVAAMVCQGLAVLHASVSLEATSALLSMSRLAVLRAGASGRLAMRRTAVGEAAFPVWQFDRHCPDGLLSGLTELIVLLDELPCWETRDVFMRSPSRNLSRTSPATPLEWLAGGGEISDVSRAMDSYL